MGVIWPARLHFVTKQGESLQSVGADGLGAWLAALEKDGLSSATIALKVSALRQFFQFLYAEGHRQDDPSAALGPPIAAAATYLKF